MNQLVVCKEAWRGKSALDAVAAIVRATGAGEGNVPSAVMADPAGEGHTAELQVDADSRQAETSATAVASKDLPGPIAEAAQATASRSAHSGKPAATAATTAPAKQSENQDLNSLAGAATAGEGVRAAAGNDGAGKGGTVKVRAGRKRAADTSNEANAGGNKKRQAPCSTRSKPGDCSHPLAAATGSGCLDVPVSVGAGSHDVRHFTCLEV